MLTFLNTRDKDRPNEAYGFLKFTSVEKKESQSSGDTEYKQLMGSSDGSIEDGGGE